MKYSQKNKMLAEKVSLYLRENTDTRTTIAELSDIFKVSPTPLKKIFREVYGIPVYKYAKQQKMLSASEMLSETDLTVTEIAGIYGYDNPSKFSSAFRNVMGISPTDYRKIHNRK